MKLQPIKIVDTSGAKLTVQKTGRFGLSKNAAEILEVNEEETSYRFCMFLTNEEEGDSALYMEMFTAKQDYCLEIRKSGMYYYIKAEALFAERNIDYRNTSVTIIFDIEPLNIKERKVYKLSKRVIEKK